MNVDETGRQAFCRLLEGAGRPKKGRWNDSRVFVGAAP
jgi:hypothetical protein